MGKTAEIAARTETGVMQRYESVIGLEVHAQLRTLTKAFCGCSARFGDLPNSHVCPVCLGLPGSLPVLNHKALVLALRASLALNCGVQPRSQFARKNYFYPDLPKGYQISMYELPLAARGWLNVEGAGAARRVGITRLHLEEDAAKAMHEGLADSDHYSCIDFNRCGVPLIEIVSEPDLRSPAEAYAYLNALKQVLEYTEVSDCNMEQGSLRCDANVSVRLRGSTELGTKTEVKNLNSFRYLQRALEYEITRQAGILAGGGSIEQETRLWNVAAGRTEPMRSKEFAHDYRYFPDPDLLPVSVTAEVLAQVRSTLPELPAAKRDRFICEYGITSYDADVLTATQTLAGYFEAVIAAGASGKMAANWISTELLRRLNDAATDTSRCPVSARQFAELLLRVERGEITAQSAKKVFGSMFGTGKSAEEIIATEGISQMQDAGEIARICREVIAGNPENAARYRAGNAGVFKFFVGQVMRQTRGQANPQLVNESLKKILDSPA